jgi:hypothetical protein
MSSEGTGIETVKCVATAAILENSFVKIEATNTAHEIKVTQCGAGDRVFGVAAEAAAAAGDLVDVVIKGLGKKVKLGGTPGAVVVGAQVKADSAGLAVLAATPLDLTGGVVLSPHSTTAADSIFIDVQRYSSVLAAS